VLNLKALMIGLSKNPIVNCCHRKTSIKIYISNKLF
jgi:hypothetical protein